MDPRPSACSGLASTVTVSKPGSEATTEIENTMEAGFNTKSWSGHHLDDSGYPYDLGNPNKHHEKSLECTDCVEE